MTTVSTMKVIDGRPAEFWLEYTLVPTWNETRNEPASGGAEPGRFFKNGSVARPEDHPGVYRELLAAADESGRPDPDAAYDDWRDAELGI